MRVSVKGMMREDIHEDMREDMREDIHEDDIHDRLTHSLMHGMMAWQGWVKGMAVGEQPNRWRRDRVSFISCIWVPWCSTRTSKT